MVHDRLRLGQPPGPELAARHLALCGIDHAQAIMDQLADLLA